MKKHTLTDALGIRDGDVVAVVGAGGKTSVIGRLAFEAVATRGRAIITSTTRFTIPPGTSLPVMTVPDLAVMRQSIEVAVRSANGAVVAGAPADDHRYLGLPPEAIGELRCLGGATLIVVNADGARMRSLKAPAEHEPVIPPATTLVVAIAGLDVLGEPLDDRRIFRHELVAAIAGVAPGSPVTGSVIARVLASPAGGRKSIPPTARFVALLNKADDAPHRAAARRIAQELRALGVDHVAISSIHEEYFELA